jgi:hypothetical protein
MLTLSEQKLVKYLDDGAKRQQYGQFTMTVIVRNGEPMLNTVRIVRMKRKKYKSIDSRTM